MLIAAAVVAGLLVAEGAGALASVSASFPSVVESGASLSVTVTVPKKASWDRVRLQRYSGGRWRTKGSAKVGSKTRTRTLRYRPTDRAGQVSLRVVAYRNGRAVAKSATKRVPVRTSNYGRAGMHSPATQRNLGRLLSAGSAMYASQYLSSPNGMYRLIMQDDGNLVLYVGTRPLWQSNTAGNPGARAKMQTDGNLVIYTSAGRAVWSTGTTGSRASLRLDDYARLSIVAGDGRGLWASGSYNGKLAPGEGLRAGQSIASPSAQYALCMQGDGNLVLYKGSRVLWTAGTQGNPGAAAVMQTDGNFVVYSATNQPLWASSTVGSGSRTLVLQDDANIVIYTNAGSAVWASGSVNSHLASGEGLRSGQYIESPARTYQLHMQGDGNLVLYQQGRALWSSRTHGHPGAWTVMQPDGNFVVYSATNQPLWASGTAGQGGVSVNLQNDGNLVLYTSGNVARWASSTAGAGGGNPTAGDDYPPYLKAGTRDSIIDPWNFWNRECTSFVAWRMNRDGGAGVFHNWTGGRRWSHARNWGAVAQAVGFRVDHTPTVGSVAQWGSPTDKGLGHVAYVCAVNADGTVNIEEYNYGLAGRYGVRRNVRAHRYIHIVR